jgi:iron(II)-dependent oxidoreductase
MKLEDWVPDTRLANWVDDATTGLLATVGDFNTDDERWIGPYLPIVNPPIWEIAHVAWFAEWFVLRQLHGRAPIMEHVDARYDSAKVPHLTRWQLNYPDVATTRDYVRRVGDALIDVVQNNEGLDSTSYYVAYAITHHDAHTEALTYTRQTLDWGTNGEPAQSPAEVNPANHDITVPGGQHLLGTSRDQPFSMDNEKWAHHVDISDFAMAAHQVSIGDFAEFVEDDGYTEERHWSVGGLTWKRANDAHHPVYWRHSPDGLEYRRVNTWRPVHLDAGLAMSHVCYWEAEAYCNWASRRLPTEIEWEVAAATAPDRQREPWFPWGSRDPRPDEANLDGLNGGVVAVDAHPSGDAGWGHRQMIGNVWEWTSSTFGPYPHFEPDAYRDNSEPWFGTRKVLRGGSWATKNRYVRSTYRNFFEPHRRDVVAGFRTCAK